MHAGKPMRPLSEAARLAAKVSEIFSYALGDDHARSSYGLYLFGDVQTYVTKGVGKSAHPFYRDDSSLQNQSHISLETL